jgi:hypothetical protein
VGTSHAYDQLVEACGHKHLSTYLPLKALSLGAGERWLPQPAVLCLHLGEYEANIPGSSPSEPTSPGNDKYTCSNKSYCSFLNNFKCGDSPHFYPVLTAESRFMNLGPESIRFSGPSPLPFCPRMESSPPHREPIPLRKRSEVRERYRSVKPTPAYPMWTSPWSLSEQKRKLYLQAPQSQSSKEPHQLWVLKPLAFSAHRTKFVQILSEPFWGHEQITFRRPQSHLSHIRGQRRQHPV